MPSKKPYIKIPRIITAVFLITLFLSPSLFSAEGAKKSKMPEYKITPHDMLKIDIYPQSDLNSELEVDSNGYIFFSFLGHVELGGLTIGEAAAKMKGLLEKDYLIEPRVIVKIIESKENVIILIGEIQKPGTYDYKLTGMTLMEAISGAGGFTDIAWINGTRIVRSVDDEEKIIKVKVGNILKGKEKDILLQPGDIIVVPESFF